MIASQLLRETTDYLRMQGVEEARLDAELLLGHVLDAERADLYRSAPIELTGALRARYLDLVRRRGAERVPLAYLTSAREFWSQTFYVTPDVLIPRPETETLVAAALEQARERAPRCVLEVGVGSGAVTAALASELPDTRFIASDLSRVALDVARANLKRLGVLDRITLVRGDLTLGLRGPFDWIVSNPPYVPSAELAGLTPEVRREPRLALDGGADGLDAVRGLIAQAPELLIQDGVLMIELGAGQAPAVRELLKMGRARAIEFSRDLTGVERVVSARFGGPGRER